jgi:hypothetical protein
MVTVYIGREARTDSMQIPDARRGVGPPDLGTGEYY